MAKIPQSIQQISESLDDKDIEKVWQYLGKTFGFNLLEWQKEFDASVHLLPRNTSRQGAFVLFGKKKIEPLLNEILKRNQSPTWIDLLSFILKEKIEAKKQRDERYKNRYH